MGFGNCDSNAANGCETNTTNTNAHCGACGNVCGSGTTCVTSVCRPGNDLPANAIALSLTNPSVTVTGNTTGATRQGACGGSVEVYYSFTLTRREVVWANTFGSAFDTTVAFTNSTGTQLSGACNDDTCGGTQSAQGVTLDAGTYLVAVGGFSTSVGAFSLTVHHLPVGNGPAVEVTDTSAGVRNFSGTTSGTGTLGQSCGTGAGPENTYWFGTCPGFTAAPFTASTCGGATWDTVVEQRSTNRTTAVCNDDTTGTCGARSLARGTLSAGAALHAVYVDGFGSTALGAYNVALSFGGCATGQTLCTDACRNLQTDSTNCGACGNACTGGLTCNAGVCTAPAPANDLPTNATTLNLTNPTVTATGTTVGATRQGTCGASSEVYYRFTLTQREVVWANTFGSGYDTTVAFASSTGTEISGTCNDDSGCGGTQSSSGTVLNAGTYLVAVGGFGTGTGAFTLNLHHLPAGNGTVAEFAGATNGTYTLTGTTSGTGLFSQSCGGSGPENTHWFTTCATPSTRTITAETCGDGQTWDSVVNVVSSNRTANLCNDDASGCGLRSRTTGALLAGPALHVVYLDGIGTAAGAYTLRVTLAN
jgi:hypothetical protein